MFTGIITNTARLRSSKKSVFAIEAKEKFVSQTKIGDSVAVSGVCLTVEKKEKDKLFFSVMPETLKRTNLGTLKTGSLLNLEQSVTMKTLLSGHLVQGHIDGVGKIKEIKKQGNSREIRITASPSILKFLVEKGSVALNGVSLTVAKLKKDSFWVAVIPHTWQETNFKKAGLGDEVNIEIDIVAKYIKKFLK